MPKNDEPPEMYDFEPTCPLMPDVWWQAPLRGATQLELRDSRVITLIPRAPFIRAQTMWRVDAVWWYRVCGNERQIVFHRSNVAIFNDPTLARGLFHEIGKAVLAHLRRTTREFDYDAWVEANAPEQY